jgi:hypothetical protein
MVGGRTSPPVGWVYIKQDIRTNPSSTNTASLPIARFAYFVEDLEGLIDAERMGASTLRSTGTNSEEISVPQVTGKSGTIVSTSDLAKFTNIRGQYITPSMLLAANGGVITDTNDLRYFATRLRACYWRTFDSNWGRVPMVPISSTPMTINGIMTNSFYPGSANKLKIVLTNLNSGGQSKIAEMITNNFPNFKNRAGGMDGQLYVNTLAANIIDYADTDSSATIANVIYTNPAATNSAIGFDSFPFLTQIFDSFVCNSAVAPPTITVTTFLQFWNPSSSSSQSTNYTLLYNFEDYVANIDYTNSPPPPTTPTTNSYPVTYRMFPIIGSYTNSSGKINCPFSISNNFAIPSLTANQGTVVSFQRIYNLQTPANVPAGFTFSKVSIDGTSGSIPTNDFTIRAGTNEIFRPKYQFYRSFITVSAAGETNWLGSILGSRFAVNVIGGPTVPRLSLDPRMLNYLTSNPTTNASAILYNNAYWQGYATERTATTIYSAHPANSPDGYSTNFATWGNTNATSANPTLGIFTIPDPAPYKISNFGSYTNICELGNIFDPIQWKPPDNPPLTNYANVDIPNTTTWTANSMHGGGSTLRIGRPEHSRFAFTNLSTNTAYYPVPALGTSAAGLLDLFCVTNTDNRAGKININTAPLPVLAALAGGITISTNSYSGTTPINMIRAFTNGVARFRNTYPFITPSQLAFISSDYGTNTTWTNNWPANAVFATNIPTGLTPGGLTSSNAPTSINDQGREEWFSKIYNLTTVQSYNYRIYVKAQLTDTNGNPKGPEIRKYYQLFIRNNTPPGSSDTWGSPSISPVVTYEAFY